MKDLLGRLAEGMGDIIGERIWGRPLSLVKKWGAAICTGFYFVRSNRRTVKIFRQTHRLIAEKLAHNERKLTA